MCSETSHQNPKSAVMSEIVTSTLGSAAQPGSLLRDPTLSARSPSQVILRVRCRYATPSRAALTKAAVALRRRKRELTYREYANVDVHQRRCLQSTGV